MLFKNCTTSYCISIGSRTFLNEHFPLVQFHVKPSFWRLIRICNFYQWWRHSEWYGASARQVAYRSYRKPLRFLNVTINAPCIQSWTKCWLPDIILRRPLHLHTDDKNTIIIFLFFIRRYLLTKTTNKHILQVLKSINDHRSLFQKYSAKPPYITLLGFPTGLRELERGPKNVLGGGLTPLSTPRSPATDFYCNPGVGLCNLSILSVKLA